MTSTEVKLDGGRQVAVYTVADGTRNKTVVLCHAAPGSGNFDPDPDVTAAAGVTLISVDRPGYGGSEPVRGDEWSSVAQAADDLAEVLHSRGDGPVGVAGWSAGGRVALALAARHPDLVDRIVVIATPAPDEEVPWIPPPQRDGLEVLRGQPAAQVHEVLEAQLSGLAALDSEGRLGLVGAGPDDGVLAMPGARERLDGMLAAAFTQGVAGMAADIAGYCLQPWGFEPGDVGAKTLLLYGAKDMVIGPRHGKWYQQRLPGARYEQVPDQGHLVVIPMWKRVLSHLAPRR